MLDIMLVRAPNEVECIDQSTNKKCGSRSISKLFQTKQDSAIKIQFIKADIADNKSKWETKIQYDCVEIIIVIKKENLKTNKN